MCVSYFKSLVVLSEPGKMENSATAAAGGDGTHPEQCVVGAATAVPKAEEVPLSLVWQRLLREAPNLSPGKNKELSAEAQEWFHVYIVRVVNTIIDPETQLHLAVRLILLLARAR